MKQPSRLRPTLREVQEWMSSLILDPSRLDGDPADFAWPLPATDTGAARTRLLAYANGYPARLREALSEAFPAVEHVVGRHRFADAVLRYVAHAPLGGYNLSEVGSNFPEFLGGDELGSEYPFLADLARLERAVLRAFHAHERRPFDAAALKDWGVEDWQRAVLTFQPAVAIVVSAWPIAEVWDVRETPTSEIDIDLAAHPQRVLVRRSGFAVVCDRITAAESRALEHLLAGATLGVTTDELADNGSNGEEVGAWFARWSRLGLVVDCRHPG